MLLFYSPLVAKTICRQKILKKFRVKIMPIKDHHNPKSEILLYTTQDGNQRIEVRLENGTVWLSQIALAELFQTAKQNISLHLKNIFEDGELETNRVVKESLTTAVDGKKYKTKFYCLEAIIAVYYRVKSSRGTV